MKSPFSEGSRNPDYLLPSIQFYFIIYHHSQHPQSAFLHYLLNTSFEDDNKNYNSIIGDIIGAASVARGGAVANNHNAFHRPAGQRRDDHHGAHHLLLRAHPLPTTHPARHQLSSTPTPTQLFILLLLAYLIFTCGQFL